MGSIKPTIVIVHAGWHRPKTYTKLTTALRQAGYEVHVPALPSITDARPPVADLATDTELVHGYVEALCDAGRQVIALMHSYGGQVGTNALFGLGTQQRATKNLPGGVSHLVYMTAFAITENMNMIDVVNRFGHSHLLPLAFDFAEDMSVVSRDPTTLLIGPGASDEEVSEYISSMVRWNGKDMYQNITQCAWREIPTTYIYATEDMTIPLDYQKWMVGEMEKAGRTVDTVELQTGHCPNLTAMDSVIKAIEQVAAKV